MAIDRTNQVWAPDITYIPMARGFVYLTCHGLVRAPHSGLALSITLGVDCCGDAVEEALRLYEVAQGIAPAYGATARVEYVRNYPITVTHERETDFTVKVATEIAGQGKVVADAPPIMAAEDFAFMLEARLGNMIFIANGDTAACDHPAYEFNDEAIPHGASYWVRLMEMGMPA